MQTLVEQFQAARRVSTPIVAIQTPDELATVAAICGAFKTGDTPRAIWNVCDGYAPLNDAAKPPIAEHIGESDPTVFNPIGAAQKALLFPAGSMIFLRMANRFFGEPGFVQAVANLRDKFKRTKRTLVLLGPAFDIPPELAHDIVALDEPLPDAATLSRIVGYVHASAKLVPDDETIERAVEAVQGLSAFQAEQVSAMSLSREGLDLDTLWERKRKQIEQTPGLKVFRDGETFDQIGGVDVVKGFCRRIMAGNARPNAVVFVDEIEKMLGGASGDTSGVSQDQLGALLSYMQDHGAAGMIFIGPPGAAKSAVAKAAGNAAGIPTIQLDLGAAKGSLVGQSEQQLRQALKVVTSVSNGRSLWIATCNSIADLPPELRRRFTLGTFFFDLPDEAERKAIWPIYLDFYGLTTFAKPDLPNDHGWTGAEIRQCCEIAWRLGCSLTEAAAFIVPVSMSAKDQIDRLRKQADGRFLSASQPGVYECRTDEPVEADRGRAIDFDDHE